MASPNRRQLQRSFVGVPTRNDRPSASLAPSALATFIICIGLTITGITLPVGEPTRTFSVAAVIVGSTLTFACLIEARSGTRNLFRTDILMLAALYGLTFLEFL